MYAQTILVGRDTLVDGQTVGEVNDCVAQNSGLFNFEIVREPGTVATITVARELRETNQLTEVGAR